MGKSSKSNNIITYFFLLFFFALAILSAAEDHTQKLVSDELQDNNSTLAEENWAAAEFVSKFILFYFLIVNYRNTL